MAVSLYTIGIGLVYISCMKWFLKLGASNLDGYIEANPKRRTLYPLTLKIISFSIIDQCKEHQHSLQ